MLRTVSISYMLKLIFGKYMLFKCLFHSKQHLQSVLHKLVSFLRFYSGIRVSFLVGVFIICCQYYKFLTMSICVL